MLDDYRIQLLQFWSAPFYLVLILAEILISNFSRRGFYSFKETLLNVYLNLANASIDLLFRGVGLFIITFFFTHRWLDFPHETSYWPVLFLLVDFSFYFEHRVDHFCRFFWAVHVTHHSSEEYNLTTGFRSSVFMPLYKCFYLAPIALLGFEPVDIYLMFAAIQIYGILVHTQTVKKLPEWIEAIFVTPSHHRVHHASNVRYLDKNMGMTLIIWDKLFGTFEEEKDYDPVRFGLTTPLPDPHHPVKIIFHEWVAIARDLKRKDIGLMNRLRYLFNPPGWSHDGSTKIAKVLQAELQESEELGSALPINKVNAKENNR